MNEPLSLNPASELESLQLQAAADPVHRAAFWKLLLSSDLWVVVESVTDSDVVLRFWGEAGEETAAAYTSCALLEAAMDPDTYWVQVSADVIFRSMVNEGLGVFINPRYESQVRLRVDELEALLDGKFDAVAGTDS